MDQKFKTEGQEAQVQVRSELDRVPERQPRSRIPFGIPRQKMTVLGEIPGWCLAWINDVGGRIEEAQLGGYEFVKRNEIQLAVGAVTPANGDLGDRISMIVGTYKQTGQPIRAYLMKIRVEHREENDRIMRELREKRMASIRKGQTTGVDKNFYVPKDNPIKLSSK